MRDAPATQSSVTVFIFAVAFAVVVPLQLKPTLEKCKAKCIN